MNIEDLWFSLSFLFIDNEIDYKSIANEISAYDLDTIKFHLFYNVAPACSINIEQTISTIWTGFDRPELIEDIKKNGIMDKTKITFKRKIYATLYQYKYRHDWNVLKSYLH